MAESITIPNEPARRFQNLTIASCIVGLCAILSVLCLPYVGNYKRSYWSTQAESIASAVPHLLIVALIATGLRRTGDILALILGIPFFFVCLLYGLLSGLGGDPRADPVAGQLAILQLAMAVAAGVDLGGNRKLAVPVNAIHRLLGLAVPVATAVTMASLAHENVRQHVAYIRGAEYDKQADAKIKAAQWLNKSSVDDVTRLARCVEQFRGDSVAGRAPKSLQEIYEWSRAKNTEHTACGTRMFDAGYRASYTVIGDMPPLDTVPHPDWGDIHHVVYYQPPKNLRGDPFRRAAFSLGIEAVYDSAEFPDAIGRPGTRNYFLDPNGEIHVTAERRRATLSDPVIPVCSRGQLDQPNHQECSPSYESRQRWGVANNLPSFSVSVGQMTHTDSVIATFSFNQVNALDSVRSVTIDWNDDGRRTTLSVPATESVRHKEVIEGTTYRIPFGPRVWHRYHTFGNTVVRATLVTRSGAEYVAADTLSVEPPPDDK